MYVNARTQKCLHNNLLQLLCLELLGAHHLQSSHAGYHGLHLLGRRALHPRPSPTHRSGHGAVQTGIEVRRAVAFGIGQTGAGNLGQRHLFGLIHNQV